jgi:hypothetical protein
MSKQEYLEFLAALQQVRNEYGGSPAKARELLREEGAVDQNGNTTPMEQPVQAIAPAE